MTWRILVAVLRVAVAVPVLATLFLLLFWLRLGWGPVELGWLAHRFAPSVVAGDALGFDRVWLRRDTDDALSLGATGLVLHRPDGHGDDLRFGRIELALEPGALLGGTASVRRFSLADATLVLARGADGSIGLDGAPAAPPGQETQGDETPDRETRNHDAKRIRFDRLRGVQLDRTAVRLRDRASGRLFVAQIATARLLPCDGLASGTVRATLAVDGRTVPVSGDGVREGRGLRWHLGTGAIRPADFAELLPALRAVDLPLSPTADLQFPAGNIRPDQAQLVVELGAGTLAVADGSLPVRNGHVSLLLRRNGPYGIAATLQQLRLALAGSDSAVPGDVAPNTPASGIAATGNARDGAMPDGAPVFTGSGTASLDDLFAPKRIRAALSINSARVAFPGLARYWPAGVAAGGRRWITENITAGEATGLHVDTALAGDAGWSSVHEVSRSGGFDAHGLEMWWLRPMPPLENMRAHATFQGSDALLIESPEASLPVEAVGPEAVRLRGNAALSPLAVSDGAMRITGLDGRDQLGAIHLVLAGALRDLMCEMANPRLSLLSKHPVPFTDPGGQVRSEVTVSLPLDNKVAIESVSVSTHSTLRGAHLGNLANNLSLDDADLTIAADTDGLQLDGEGAVGPVDSTLHYAMDFRDGGPDQLVEQARVEGMVGAAALQALGIDPGSQLGGNGALVLGYGARRDGRSTVQLELDMTGLALTLPVWSKRAGQAAHADATIVLDHGHLRSVGPVHADGPGLSIEGEVSTPTDAPRLLRVRRFMIGRTRGGGEIVFPRAGPKAAGEPIRIRARGEALDLSAIIDAVPTAGSAPGGTPAAGKARPKLSARTAGVTPTPAGPAWSADLRFDRVFVGRDTALGHVTASLENDGQALTAARVEATEPTRLSVRLQGSRTGRTLEGTAADTGALLRGLGVTDQVNGGTLHLSARLPYPALAPSRTAPMTGSVEIGRFVLPHAPVAARIARDVSIYGWLLAPNTPQLAVDRLVAPFSLDGEVLTLIDARAHAAALGVTMRGPVDLGRQRLDLSGTVVPAWALNQLPGQVPLLGRLLAPEKGGGVVAVTLRVKGPFSDPTISLNPLSALAPGFLRKLLFD